MSLPKKILFIIVEFISAFLIGSIGVYFFISDPPTSSLNDSIIIAFLVFYVLAFLGFSIPAFFHSIQEKKRRSFPSHILHGFLFFFLGLILMPILEGIIDDLFFKTLASRYISLSIPILFTLVGFNVSLFLSKKNNAIDPSK